MQTRIISAFPGTGKSYYHCKHPNTTLDSDSSEFHWAIKDGKKIPNKWFPANYISHIKDNIGKYEFIFVSSHKEVRDALFEACLHFYLIYPPEYMKRHFLNRYKERGSPDDFIERLDENWKIWIRECSLETRWCTNIQMTFKVLEKELHHIVASENGDKKDD